MSWNLDDIINSNDFNEELLLLEHTIKDFDKDLFLYLNGKRKIQDFKKIVLRNEKILCEINKIYAFPHLKSELNSTDTYASYQKSKAKNIIALYEDVIRNFFHWVKGIQIDKIKPLNDLKATKLFSRIGDLEYYYTRIRKLSSRTLSLKEEEIILKLNLILKSALNEVRNTIETEQIYTFTNPTTNKKEKHSNSSKLLSNLYSHNELIRKNSYLSLFKPFIKNIQKYFSIYEAVVKSWVQESKWRGYASPIEVRNELNDVSNNTVENLIESTRNNRNIFQDFFKLKAQLLNVNKITRYDIYAPIGGRSSKDIPFNTAKKTTLNIFRQFDKQFYLFAKRLFTEGHIDFKPQKYKTSGAFCATLTPNIDPYILLNYSGNSRDVLILAHELGHAIHSMLASNLPCSIQEAPLVLAETASTFCELIVFEFLFKNEKSIDVRRQMLMDKITDSYATICRQIYFVKFENEAHKEIPKGIELSELNNLYMQNLEELYGDSISIDKIFMNEWAYVPHIVDAPFYCYSYAFGNLLSLVIYKKFINKDIDIIDIKEILAAGGSENPSQLLSRIGIDIENPLIWSEGFDIVRDWLNELRNTS